MPRASQIRFSLLGFGAAFCPLTNASRAERCMRVIFDSSPTVTFFRKSMRASGVSYLR
jgi:hypothetical protein